ncbi:crotonase/enoyl-CoA hydratase family protein [Kordiimonas sp. SCSIO 12610]|uniref:crotonase/enoyl-CoA hydratase family protein n=1 Tax=Kordiimonas sp. SCSIO 12610 TaxID=2829597 RepID=UPI00210EFA9A|nr:crotonase/enoyl-CoA hydratase family protein [Kordiimonas sp. SCSIO 12610]UTW55215.1 crotonase/enoyl-CoA hydratase family protein [Kordiimonas sp. SCSIO 12610]
MAYETLNVAIDGHVAHVALNRPDKLNAMNSVFFKEIKDAFENLDHDPNVRAIILSGNGKHFTAGLDLKENDAVMGTKDQDPAREREKLRRHILWLQDCFSVIENANAPVIAAIHGACIGGGIDLISACDIRVASSDTWLCIQEINVAIVADLGTLQRMNGLVPQGILREWALTGRKVAVEETQHFGLMNYVEPSKDEALAKAQEIAATIASKSPVAVTGTKKVLIHARDHDVQDGLDYVATWNSGMLLGNDLPKAAMAALKKETPEFENLLVDKD